MSAWTALLLACLVGAAAAAPTGQQRQASLRAGRALPMPQQPDPRLQQQQQQQQPSTSDLSAVYTPQWWAQQKQPPPPSWWQRLLPPAWRGSQRAVRVAPVLPDGRGVAPPAELLLPTGRGALTGQVGAAGGQGLTAAVNPADPADSEFYSYNSSAMTPLVPMWLAWMTDEERMNNRSHGLDFQTAWILSSYVAISYCNTSSIAAWNCSRCNGISAGFEPEEVVFDDAWDLQGFVGYSRPLDGIVIAFRGTDSHSIYNWVNNMRTWRTDLALNYPGAPPHALVHGGFFYSYNGSALASNISAAVGRLRERHPNSTVYVSGHSMGGALATLCALDMRLNLGFPDVRLYTYGSPRVGNLVFAQWFEEQISVHWRFTHDRDIVPSVPPGYMGFYHLSREVWLVDLLFGHTLVGVCDETGEDMACHNSMCHLGLCSSVADHLLYLSEMYSPHPGGC